MLAMLRQRETQQQRTYHVVLVGWAPLAKARLVVSSCSVLPCMAGSGRVDTDVPPCCYLQSCFGEVGLLRVVEECHLTRDLSIVHFDWAHPQDF